MLNNFLLWKDGYEEGGGRTGQEQWRTMVLVKPDCVYERKSWVCKNLYFFVKRKFFVIYFYAGNNMPLNKASEFFVATLKTTPTPEKYI